MKREHRNNSPITTALGLHHTGVLELASTFGSEAVRLVAKQSDENKLTQIIY